MGRSNFSNTTEEHDVGPHSAHVHRDIEDLATVISETAEYQVINCDLALTQTHACSILHNKSSKPDKQAFGTK